MILFNMNDNCSSLSIKKVYYVFMCDRLLKPIFALNCRLQVEQVNSGNNDIGDYPLALALRSLRFLSASQTLFASY